MENLVAVLGAGATVADVTMVEVHMKDLDADYDEMNRIYRELFGDKPPARATVEVSRLAFNLPIEISCIAVLP